MEGQLEKFRAGVFAVDETLAIVLTLTTLNLPRRHCAILHRHVGQYVCDMQHGHQPAIPWSHKTAC